MWQTRPSVLLVSAVDRTADRRRFPGPALPQGRLASDDNGTDDRSQHVGGPRPLYHTRK
jgi:hypothetical protein